MIKQNSGLAHCLHHGTHWEFCHDFNEREDYIRENKPADEVELRLKLFKLIPDEICPGKDSAEWQAFQALQAYDTAWPAHKAGQAFQVLQAYDTAWRAYLNKYADELAVLHSKLFPDCPWDGKTIFIKVKK